MHQYKYDYGYKSTEMYNYCSFWKAKSQLTSASKTVLN